MKTIILGAGASKAYTASPSRQKMPIANDFFSIYENLDISANRWVLIGDILNVASKEYGTNYLNFLSSNIDIEEFHSLVEEKLLSILKNYTPEKFFKNIEYWNAYHQLVFLFSSVVNEIQNGPVSEPHVSLSSTLEQGDAVLTFNWDTLMDRAMAENSNWNVDNGYGINPKAVFRNKWSKIQLEDQYSGPILLKLHGSSNWITSYPQFDHSKKEIALSQISTPETLYVYEYAYQPYSTFAGRFIGPYQPFSYFYYPPNLLDDPGKPAPDGHFIAKMRIKSPLMPEGGSDSKGLVSMPLIIPPVKDKNYGLFGSLFSSLWNKAEKYLIDSEKIIIIGYSFPKTDLKSRDLFKKAFLKRKNMPKVIIVNPAPESIKDIFIYDFGINEDYLRVFKDFFNDSFDLSKLAWTN